MKLRSPLPWLGLGATIIGAAFALRPVHASDLVFWGILSLGTLTVLTGVAVYVRRGPRPQLVASECRRVCGATKNLLDEQCRHQPKSGRFGSAQERHQQWEDATVSRFERELQPWATRVFAQAVTAGAISEASRPILNGRTVLQLKALCDLFREAAEELEQS